MIGVFPIPPAHWREHERLSQGESRFCDWWSFELDQHGVSCPGGAEVMIQLGKNWPSRVLCREHAGEIAASITEAVEMVDARQVFNR